MRFRHSALLAATCIGALFPTDPAFSRPVPRAEPVNVRLPVPRPKNIASRPVAAAAPIERAPTSERVALLSYAARPIFGSPDLVAEARKYMGTNPTDRKRLWCATFMNFILAKLGYSGTNSDAARSFAYYGRRISEPQVGAIAVLTRGKRGGHVGVVSGIDKDGNPIIISGNHNKRVGEAVYARSRVIAYVMPTEHRPVTTQVAARGPVNVPGERGLDSPIAELLAAIEAERNKPEPARSAPSSTRPQAQRPATAPVVPHRVVQQTALPQDAARPGLGNPFSELLNSGARAERPASRNVRGRVAAAEHGRLR